MALTAPSSKLTAQAISASFDQLLYLDSAAGMVDTTLKIVSTETGHSALQITNDQVLILDKSGTDIASLFEVQDKDANIILSVNGTNNNVGIGTAAPDNMLHMEGSAPELVIKRNANNDGAPKLTLIKARGTSVGDYTIVQDDDDLGYINFLAADGGDYATVGATIYAKINGTPGANDMPTELRFGTTADGANSPTDRMSILANGNVGIGVPTPQYELNVDGHIGIEEGGALIWHYEDSTNKSGSILTNSADVMYFSNTSSDTTRMSIAAGGTVDVVGELTAGTKTFKIDHPLPGMKDSNYLIHSCVEAPKADLIYRGKVDLVSGGASINIDTEVGMTDGTFVLLCDDVQCFTTNESNWDKVKGSVSGNVLTIESENTDSTASISWMVIGDRKDEKIINALHTDENGKFILEPLKIEHDNA